MSIKIILSLISSITFITYGVLCLGTDHMKLEFERYGLSKYRKITGFFELLGGIGSAVGLFLPIIYQISTLGLSILMLMGLVVRIRLKDRLIEALPALILAALNSYLFSLTF